MASHRVTIDKSDAELSALDGGAQALPLLCGDAASLPFVRELSARVWQLRWHPDQPGSETDIL